MEFTVTEQQREFRTTMIDFARSVLNPGARERDAGREFSRELWKKCADMDIFGLPIPGEYGGLGTDMPGIVSAMEGLGYGCIDNGLVFAINTQLWSCIIPILHFGTNAQKSKYLPLLRKGELIGGHAMTEPQTGSDAFGLQTQAKRVEGGYLLKGGKVFITNAPVADLMIVFARTAPEKKFMGVSAFIVEKDMKGVYFGKNIECMGLRTCPVGELSLDDCWVPDENRLGGEGAGAAIFNSEMEWERSCLFACHTGVMERLVEKCHSYAGRRLLSGTPIGAHQAISHTIADMKVRLELSRLIIYKIAWMKSCGKPAPLESAIAKLFVSESLVSTCREAVQIFGAYGYSEEYEIERDLRDSIASTIYSGSSEIQRTTIYRLLDMV